MDSSQVIRARRDSIYNLGHAINAKAYCCLPLIFLANALSLCFVLWYKLDKSVTESEILFFFFLFFHFFVFNIQIELYTDTGSGSD